MINTNVSNKLSKDQFYSLHVLVDTVAKRQLEDFGHINSEVKPDGSLITNCDRWSDNHIVEGIAKLTNKKEGVLSEEGSKNIPSTNAYWIVDPLDGTTNFAAGIPFWAISIARFVEGKPETAILDIPALKKRIVAIKGEGVWLNEKKIEPNTISTKSDCVSVCSRSISVLQKKPDQRFPGKIRLLGVSSLNITSVALGQTFAALEATPKIWDVAASLLILNELRCCIKWLSNNPINLPIDKDLSAVNFPLIAANSEKNLQKLELWGDMLLQ